MNPSETGTPSREAAVKSLAAIGFVTLIAAGIWLAVFAARYVPNVVGSIGSAAVSLSQIFTPNTESPAAVSTSTPATTTPATIATSTTATTTQTTKPSTTTKPGTGRTGTVPLDGAAATTTPAALYGLPDIAVSIDAIGYLATSSAESFIASSTVPNGMRPAVKFTIRNVGTNLMGAWRFTASIPTVSAFVYQSPLQQMLNPGDRIQYVLGFDQSKIGPNQPISIIANYDRTVPESNYTNDAATASITVTGS